jgi:Protein of unknown function (DUF992)
MRKFSIALFAVVALAVTVSAAPNALAQGEAPAKHVTKLGYLSCHVASGWGFIFGSSRSINCTFNAGQRAERYTGTIQKFGVDIGYYHSGVLIWGVFAPTSDIGPGSLAGSYGGATATAAVGVGVGANVLVGGSNKSITLQPVSIEGATGLNVAAGIGALTLKAAPGM